MPYELRRFLIEDLEKIEGLNSQFKNIVSRMKFLLEGGMKRKEYFWAVDNTNGSFLLFVPITVRPDTAELEFIFLFRGKLHRVIAPYGIFSNDIRVERIGLLSDKNQEILKARLTEAFKVYGWDGNCFEDSFPPNGNDYLIPNYVE